jgi:hypothetical protein
MIWLLAGLWIAIGWYEWWRMIRDMPWVLWAHLMLVLVFMLLGPIAMICIRFDEWQERKDKELNL